MKLWGGRFSGRTLEEVEEYTNSLKTDHRLYTYDIKGSQVYAQALRKAGVITSGEERKIVSALNRIKKEMDSGSFSFHSSDEDIHTAIERRLVELTGDIGKKLHAGRSRNEQVVLDVRMFMKDAGKELLYSLAHFVEVLAEKAIKYASTIMPGYTHLQRAQVVTAGHHLNAYACALYRHLTRFQDFLERNDELPLGSGALASNTLGLDRRFMAEKLGFSRICLNSMDAVSFRDLLAEFTFICAAIMVTLSRFAEELILWASDEFSFVELPDEMCTGSSLMPHKKNPDVPELVRGKAGGVIAAAVALLALEKNLPLTYNRDLQEGKVHLFSAFDTTLASVNIMCMLVERLEFRRDILAGAAEDWKLLMTDLAEKLVQKGVPFRTAHEAVGKLVKHLMDNKESPVEIRDSELKKIHPALDPEDVKTLCPEGSVKARKVPGGPHPSEVKKTARRLLNLVKAHTKNKMC